MRKSHTNFSYQLAISPSASTNDEINKRIEEQTCFYYSNCMAYKTSITSVSSNIDNISDNLMNINSINNNDCYIQIILINEIFRYKHN